MWKSFVIAFSTYSKIPMPNVEWNEKSMRYSMCFFPLVGAALGLLSMGCFYALRAAGVGRAASAAVLCALPVLVSGGIHMDGFLDTVDAKSSYRSAAERLEILKDPHTGAFAIICGALYFLAYFGAFTEVAETEIACVAVGYVYSRVLSALSVVTFRKAKCEGMAAAAADAAEKKAKWILGAELIFVIALFLYLAPTSGGVCILAGLICFWRYRAMAYRLFGGITGDLAGYFLQVCELAVLISAAAVSKIV